MSSAEMRDTSTEPDGLLVVCGNIGAWSVWRVPESYVERWEWRGFAFATRPLVAGGRLVPGEYQVTEVRTGFGVGYTWPDAAEAKQRAVEQLERHGEERVRRVLDNLQPVDATDVRDVLVVDVDEEADHAP